MVLTTEKAPRRLLERLAGAILLVLGVVAGLVAGVDVASATAGTYGYDVHAVDVGGLDIGTPPGPADQVGPQLGAAGSAAAHPHDDLSNLARAVAPSDGYRLAPQAIRNPVPQRLARVIDADFINAPRLGGPGTDRVFVTAADDIAGITSSGELAERLTLLDDSFKLRRGPFAVLEFDTPAAGLGSPVFRTNPGFVGFGRTAGGAREFDLPNLLLDDLWHVSRRIVE